MGLSGAGKTSVLTEVKRKREDITLVNYGDIATEVGIKAELVENRDQVLALAPDQIKELQVKVVESLEDNPKTILDTHALLALKPMGFMSGLTDSLFEKIKIEGMIYIDASSEEVMKRRKEDTSRDRMIIELNELNQNRIRSNEIIDAYAKKYKVQKFTIKNSDGQFDNTVKELLLTLTQLGW